MDQFKKIQSRAFSQTATASKPVIHSTPTRPASAGKSEGRPPISRPRPLRRREKLIKVEDICPVTIIGPEDKAHRDIPTRYRALFNDDEEDDGVEGLYKSLPPVQPLRLQKQKEKSRTAHSGGVEVAGPSQCRYPVPNSPLRHPVNARITPGMPTHIAQASSLSTPNLNVRKRTHVRDPSIRYAQYEPLGTRAKEADRDMGSSAGRRRLHPQDGPSVSWHGRSLAKALGFERQASPTAAKPKREGTNTPAPKHSLASRGTGLATDTSASNADIMRFARSPHVAAAHLQRVRSDAAKVLDNLPVAKWGPEGSEECVALAKILKKEEKKRAQVSKANVKTGSK